MAVIKCSNCENEILDSEIVCPYCDFPVNNTDKAASKDDFVHFSAKSVDDVTGKIPVAGNNPKDDKPKIATSSDFEKEKAAILKDIKLDDAVAETNPELQKTVKISLDEISGNKAAISSQTATTPKIKKPVPKGKKYKKNKTHTKYIIIGVTILGIILIASLVSKIAGTISDGINRQKKTNKTVTVTSSAEEIEREQGFSFSSSTLTIKDEKVMVDYSSSKDTPWYQYKDSVKHITISDKVTKIGAHSFDGFKNVTDVKFSKDVTVVGDFAFYNCSSLKKVSIPDSNDLMEIGESAFENCGKLDYISGYTKDAKFEPSIVVIGDRAFAGCSSILEFKLPDDVKLGEDVFDSHNEDFAIICSKLGNAYEYAKDNNIPVKEDFDEGIIEEEYLEEIEDESTEDPDENTEGESKDKPKDDQTNTNEKDQKDTSADSNNQETNTTTGQTNSNSGDNSATTGNTTPPPAPSVSEPSQAEKDQALKDLSDQLQKATTDEERGRILGEMDKYY